MKKSLLILGLIAAPCLLNAQVNSAKNNVGSATNPATVSGTTTGSDVTPAHNTTGKPAGANQKRSSKRGVISYNFIKIGNTKYDLQTNASMGRRIMLHSDGTISAVWTTSTDNEFTNRGTGYNYYNGTSWNAPVTPTPRNESVRTGWPTIGVLANGKEYTIAHESVNGGFIVATNAGKGSTSWTTNTTAVLTEANRRPIWGRAGNNGNIIHLVASYADSALAGEKRAPKIKGVFAPVTYSRSMDGGSNWDIQHILLPGYDSTRFVSGGGDQYAIDVRDSIVAIISGDLTEDVTIWKSTDNGTTFTKIIADSFPYAPYKSNKLMLDTPFVCDGSVDVMIDNAGKVHGFWGVSRVLDSDTTDQSYSFFPGISGLAYWNETTKQVKFIASGAEFDRSGDGLLTLKQGTFSSLSNGNIPSGIFSVARLGNTAAMHMPSAGIDASGNIFVSFSLPMEDDIDVNDLNFRDICLTHSTDGGATWANAQDLTQWLQSEEEFGCIARKVDNFVHLIFQKDEIPGTNLQNNSQSANNHPIPDAGNDIYYAAVPVSEIMNGNIGKLFNTGVEEVNADNQLFFVSQNKPNPFGNTSEVMIWLNQSTDLTMEVTNIMGQVMQTETYDNLQRGNQVLTINANGYTPGVYFYTLKAGGQSISKKMIVE